jgi:hypothetical protein
MRVQWWDDDGTMDEEKKDGRNEIKATMKQVRKD